MGKEDLQKVFLLSGIAGACLAVVAAFFNPHWALCYFLVSSLSLMNWIALAAIFSGLAGRKPIPLVAGLMAKPLIVALFLVLGVGGYIEFTSFLAGVNTFFAVLILSMVFRSFLSKKSPRNAAPVSEVYG